MEPPPAVGYRLAEVAALVGWSEKRVRTLVSAGLLDAPAAANATPTDDRLFTFQDLVLLRTARGLLDAGVPSRRVRSALRRLRDSLPSGRALSSLRIAADQRRVVVQDQGARWEAESGQTLLDLSTGDLARRAAPFARRRADELEAREAPGSAEEWFTVGVDLETTSPESARIAYERALVLGPELAEAHLNLGRLLHEARDFEAAERHYREAIRLRPEDPTAFFNLGVALEDKEQAAEALDAYQRSIALDPDFADAYYNLAGLYERLGKKAAAVRHLKTYKRLRGG